MVVVVAALQRGSVRGESGEEGGLVRNTLMMKCVIIVASQGGKFLIQKLRAMQDSFDKRYPTFSGDPRNVRLVLATDGFNSFKTMNVAHSTWPVLILVYNLPSWMCMKQPYFILSTLIPDPKGPGNDIDVYLQPLIEELKELWIDRVETYDASRNEMFRMHAALFWTLFDFPGYAMVSGWSTKGYLACPTCNKDTCSHFLDHSKKICYDGHHCFLEKDHKYRRCKSAFDGIEEKGNDGLKARLDLQDMGVRPSLHPQERGSNKFYLPPANFTLSSLEKSILCRVLNNVKVPDGYLMALKNYVRNRGHLECSIAEGYLAEECLTFCSCYLTNIETRFDRPQRNSDNVLNGEEMNDFGAQGRALGKQEFINLDEMTLVKHKRFLKMRQRYLKPRQLQKISHNLFHKWFNERLRDSEDPIPNELRWLAPGPNPVTKWFKKFMINGLKFHVRDVERRRKTQNSGVVIKAVTSSYTRATNQNPVTGNIQYYGVLTDIIELNYNVNRKVVLFKCDWFDVLSKGKGIKEDDFRFKLVNSLRSLGIDEPFILASQAEQVFYVDDPIDNE
ncbi:uncharacterized protein LOC132316559 [Cornus florida]|uniref:uncharacterized protein LOC132316559 n=1 Tax=Cornus florida TaxID=4283 RepID=UPI00289F2A6A|nr:uncharacterized protein LOC132316559 [Cornus florida]